MKRVAKTPLVLIVALLLSGCTFVTVTKLSPNSENTAIKGQRISLPRPYIKVTPKDDGDIEATIIYLPDPEHTYAIDSSSYFATDQLDVTTAEGVVTAIKWTGDSSGVVAEAIKSSGNVAGEILKAEETKKAAQKTKEEEASKAVDDAQLEVDVAQSRLNVLLKAKPQSPPDIQLAQISLEAALVKLKAAKDRLARVRGILTSPKEDEANQEVVDARRMLEMAQNNLTNLIGRSGIPPNDILIAQLLVNLAAFRLWEAQDERNQMMGKTQGQMFGPMLFAIHEEIRESAPHKTVFPFLEVVTVQQNPDPNTGNGNPSQPKYPVKWPEAPTPQKVRIFPEGTNTVPDQNNSWRLTLQSSAPLARLVEGKTTFKDKNGTPISQLPAITFTPPTNITVNLENLSADDYTLNLAFQTRELGDHDEKDESTPVKIKIMKKSP